MKRVIGLSVATVLCPLASGAQEAEPGGVFFTFDVGQTLEATTDRDLETVDEENGVDSLTALSFGAVSETRAQRFSFTLGTNLRVSEGEFSDDGVTAQLAYSRNSADALLDVSLEARRQDIAFLRDASDFINDDGVIELPDDFDDLTGTGIRAATTLTASLTWGETAPVGYALRASQQQLRYEDASTALVDSDTASVGFGLRLNLNEVTTGNIELGYEQTDEVGSPITDTTTLSAALTFVRPLGDLTTRISASRDDEEDVFWAASIEREYDLPGSTLSGALGVVEDENGEVRPTGRIAYSLPRPGSQIDLSAVHNLSPGDDVATTTVSASYARELSPVSNMQIGFDFGQTSAPDGSDSLATAGLTASYGISLTEVWQLSLGARADVRDDDGTRTRANTIFVTLQRPFSFRP